MYKEGWRFMFGTIATALVFYFFSFWSFFQVFFFSPHCIDSIAFSFYA